MRVSVRVSVRVGVRESVSVRVRARSRLVRLEQHLEVDPRKFAAEDGGHLHQQLGGGGQPVHPRGDERLHRRGELHLGQVGHLRKVWEVRWREGLAKGNKEKDERGMRTTEWGREEW
eukprot:4467645-Pleurochrysis_carterae.AAC.1